MMPLSIFFAGLWCLAAGIAGLAPQRFHWGAVWVLIVAGIPLLGYVTYENGPVIGLLALFGGISVLRWAPRLLALSERWTGGAEGASGRDAVRQEPEGGAWTG